MSEVDEVLDQAGASAVFDSGSESVLKLYTLAKQEAMNSQGVLPSLRNALPKYCHLVDSTNDGGRTGLVFLILLS